VVLVVGVAQQAGKGSTHGTPPLAVHDAAASPCRQRVTAPWVLQHVTVPGAPQIEADAQRTTALRHACGSALPPTTSATHATTALREPVPAQSQRSAASARAAAIAV